MLGMLKSGLFWQLLGGFALGTIGMVVFGSPDSVHALASHLGGLVGVAG